VGRWSECEPEHGETFTPVRLLIRAHASTAWAVSKHGTSSSNVQVQLRDPQLHQTAAFNYQLTSAMSADTNKENIADGLLAPLEATSVGTRKSKKSRSLSAGPGSLNVPLKEESGNRRKV
jgi:hypothetical protein